MGFSTALLILATAAGTVGGSVAWRYRNLRPRSVILWVGIASAVPAFVITAVWFTDRIIESQGAAHTLYLVAVVSVPVCAALFWIRANILAGRDRELVKRGTVLIATILCVVPAALEIYATHIEPSWVRLDRHTIAADIAGPVRVTVVSDLHINSVGVYERRIVDDIISTDPDIVIVAGD
jgi:hypothetical protein